MIAPSKEFELQIRREARFAEWVYLLIAFCVFVAQLVQGEISALKNLGSDIRFFGTSLMTSATFMMRAYGLFRRRCSVSDHSIRVYSTFVTCLEILFHLYSTQFGLLCARFLILFLASVKSSRVSAGSMSLSDQTADPFIRCLLAWCT